MTPPHYIGKSEYCYSNSVAMMLATLGERIEPSTIEVLTGMGIGAFLEKGSGFLFFDCSTPDTGITRALHALGFDFLEIWQEEPAQDPMPGLIEALQEGPVILGPLDLGLLSYNPHTLGESGADHYALAYDADNAFVFLHDPWGFPCAMISHAELREAWRADTIDYKRGYFRAWRRLWRVENPSKDEIYQRALAGMKTVYSGEQMLLEKAEIIAGSQAIRVVARLAHEGMLRDKAREFLIGFSLPLATRRALDYATFLELHQGELSDLKYRQARALGICQTYAVARDGQLGTMLHHVADLEDAFREIVTAVRQS